MNDGFAETYIALLLILFLVSLLPIIIAFARSHPNRWIIFIVTVVFGATGLGWLVALVWSLHGFHRDKATGSYGGASGLNLFADDVKAVRIVCAADDVPRLAVTTDTAAPDPRSIKRNEPVFQRLTISEASLLLERLHSLKAQGHISEKEAAEMKASIITQARP